MRLRTSIRIAGLLLNVPLGAESRGSGQRAGWRLSLCDYLEVTVNVTPCDWQGLELKSISGRVFAIAIRPTKRPLSGDASFQLEGTLLYDRCTAVEKGRGEVDCSSRTTAVVVEDARGRNRIGALFSLSRRSIEHAARVFVFPITLIESSLRAPPENVGAIDGRVDETGWLLGWPVGWLVGWLTGRLAGRLDDCR